MTDSDPDWIMNPATNRKMKKGTRGYFKLLAVQKSEIIADEEMIPTPEHLQQPVKKVLAKELVNIVADNKPKFSDLSKRETDKLLRKLLLEKLKPKKKPKKKKKKIITPPSSSSESSSDSSSESSSDSD